MKVNNPALVSYINECGSQFGRVKSFIDNMSNVWFFLQAGQSVIWGHLAGLLNI
jgi:hypothetical protein